MINIYDTLFSSIKKGYMGPEREEIKLCISTKHAVLYINLRIVYYMHN